MSDSPASVVAPAPISPDSDLWRRRDFLKILAPALGGLLASANFPTRVGAQAIIDPVLYDPLLKPSTAREIFVHTLTHDPAQAPAQVRRLGKLLEVTDHWIAQIDRAPETAKGQTKADAIKAVKAEICSQAAASFDARLACDYLQRYQLKAEDSKEGLGLLHKTYDIMAVGLGVAAVFTGPLAAIGATFLGAANQGGKLWSSGHISDLEGQAVAEQRVREARELMAGTIYSICQEEKGTRGEFFRGVLGDLEVCKAVGVDFAVKTSELITRLPQSTQKMIRDVLPDKQAAGEAPVNNAQQERLQAILVAAVVTAVENKYAEEAAKVEQAAKAEQLRIDEETHHRLVYNETRGAAGIAANIALVVFERPDIAARIRDFGDAAASFYDAKTDYGKPGSSVGSFSKTLAAFNVYLAGAMMISSIFSHKKQEEDPFAKAVIEGLNHISKQIVGVSQHLDRIESLQLISIQLLERLSEQVADGNQVILTGLSRLTGEYERDRELDDRKKLIALRSQAEEQVHIWYKLLQAVPGTVGPAQLLVALTGFARYAEETARNPDFSERFNLLALPPPLSTPGIEYTFGTLPSAYAVLRTLADREAPPALELKPLATTDPEKSKLLSLVPNFREWLTGTSAYLSVVLGQPELLQTQEVRDALTQTIQTCDSLRQLVHALTTPDAFRVLAQAYFREFSKWLRDVEEVFVAEELAAARDRKRDNHPTPEQTLRLYCGLLPAYRLEPFEVTLPDAGEVQCRTFAFQWHVSTPGRLYALDEHFTQANIHRLGQRQSFEFFGRTITADVEDRPVLKLARVRNDPIAKAVASGVLNEQTYEIPLGMVTLTRAPRFLDSRNHHDALHLVRADGMETWSTAKEPSQNNSPLVRVRFSRGLEGDHGILGDVYYFTASAPGFPDFKKVLDECQARLQKTQEVLWSRVRSRLSVIQSLSNPNSLARLNQISALGRVSLALAALRDSVAGSVVNGCAFAYDPSRAGSVTQPNGKQKDEVGAAPASSPGAAASSPVTTTQAENHAIPKINPFEQAASMSAFWGIEQLKGSLAALCDGIQSSDLPELYAATTRANRVSLMIRLWQINEARALGKKLQGYCRDERFEEMWRVLKETPEPVRSTLFAAPGMTALRDLYLQPEKRSELTQKALDADLFAKLQGDGYSWEEIALAVPAGTVIPRLMARRLQAGYELLRSYAEEKEPRPGKRFANAENGTVTRAEIVAAATSKSFNKFQYLSWLDTIDRVRAIEAELLKCAPDGQHWSDAHAKQIIGKLSRAEASYFWGNVIDCWENVVETGEVRPFVLQDLESSSAPWEREPAFAAMLTQDLAALPADTYYWKDLIDWLGNAQTQELRSAVEKRVAEPAPLSATPPPVVEPAPLSATPPPVVEPAPVHSDLFPSLTQEGADQLDREANAALEQMRPKTVTQPEGSLTHSGSTPQILTTTIPEIDRCLVICAQLMKASGREVPKHFIW